MNKVVLAEEPWIFNIQRGSFGITNVKVHVPHRPLSVSPLTIWSLNQTWKEVYAT
jgi:hypothetical protein